MHSVPKEITSLAELSFFHVYVICSLENGKKSLHLVRTDDPDLPKDVIKAYNDLDRDQLPNAIYAPKSRGARIVKADARLRAGADDRPSISAGATARATPNH